MLLKRPIFTLGYSIRPSFTVVRAPIDDAAIFSRRQHESWEQNQIVFAGDIGNDCATRTAGYLSIVAGNAHQSVRERVMAAHLEQQWTDRLHLAEGHSTTGVLEGCRNYGMF